MVGKAAPGATRGRERSDQEQGRWALERISHPQATHQIDLSYPSSPYPGKLLGFRTRKVEVPRLSASI